MDRGKVARYTKDNSPGDFPLIADLYAPKEYYDDNDDPTGVGITMSQPRVRKC